MYFFSIVLNIGFFLRKALRVLPVKTRQLQQAEFAERIDLVVHGFEQVSLKCFFAFSTFIRG